MDAHDSKGPQTMLFTAKDTHGKFLVRGDMTFATASQGLKQSSALLKGKYRSVRFDLGDISRADSSGAGLLIEWLRIARSSGCELSFVNIPAPLKAMIRVAGVEGMLPIDV